MDRSELLAAQNREILELCRRARVDPSALAKKAGLSHSTVTRPLKTKVKHARSAVTMDLLRKAASELMGKGQDTQGDPVSPLVSLVPKELIEDYADMTRAFLRAAGINPDQAAKRARGKKGR